MQPKRWKVRLVCGLSLLFLTGCFHNSPYGPYGSGAYPGVYNTVPAGSAVPNGVIMQPPATLTQPGVPVPQWQQSQDPISPGPSAPFYDSNEGSGSDPGGANLVPPYKDPGDLNSGQDDLKLNESDDVTPLIPNGV